MSEKPDKPLGRVVLKNWRLSFPHLWEPYAGPGTDADNAAYGAVFMLPKDAENFEEEDRKVKEAMKGVIRDKWPNNPPKIPMSKRCYRDGDEETRPEYEGHMILSARRAKKLGPPEVVDNRKANGQWVRLTEEDGRPYAGCWVNAVVTIWAMDHPRYGKRIAAVLEAVQFRADGEPFATSRVKPEEYFDDEDLGAEEFDDDEEDIF